MGPTTLQLWRRSWREPSLRWAGSRDATESIASRTRQRSLIEAQRGGNRRMPLAFDVGGIAVERDIERHPWAHVEANASRRIPHLTCVAGAAAHLENAEAIFITGVKRVAAESLPRLRDCGPSLGVVSDISAIVHRQFDAGVSDRYRHRLEKG